MEQEVAQVHSPDIRERGHVLAVLGLATRALSRLDVERHHVIRLAEGANAGGYTGHRSPGIPQRGLHANRLLLLDCQDLVYRSRVDLEHARLVLLLVNWVCLPHEEPGQFRILQPGLLSPFRVVEVGRLPVGFGRHPLGEHDLV
eukprot:16312539-Heterocapsa_arctica.AAC.3